ncbi:MAG: hypothetical protein LUG51_07945 [Tannerellaceae bacterium]|nr:hypothetical protein [Tannerellaceae bacterium]
MKKLESFLSFLLAVANLFVSRWKKVPPCRPCPYPDRNCPPTVDGRDDPWCCDEEITGVPC